MRAVAVRSFKTKPEFMDLPTPEANNDEILVRLSAAGMNPFDWKISDGRFVGQMPNTFPLVMGFDGAGVIEAIGPGVRRFKKGDGVFGQFLADAASGGVGLFLVQVA
jgi:NADPH:quinone reductase